MLVIASHKAVYKALVFHSVLCAESAFAGEFRVLYTTPEKLVGVEIVYVDFELIVFLVATTLRYNFDVGRNKKIVGQIIVFEVVVCSVGCGNVYLFCVFGC